MNKIKTNKNKNVTVNGSELQTLENDKFIIMFDMAKKYTIVSPNLCLGDTLPCKLVNTITPSANRTTSVK